MTRSVLERVAACLATGLFAVAVAPFATIAPASAAEETPLSAGLEHERRLYELAMATEDRVEGMTAFLEKRRPEFKGR